MHKLLLKLMLTASALAVAACSEDVPPPQAPPQPGYAPQYGAPYPQQYAQPWGAPPPYGAPSPYQQPYQQQAWGAQPPPVASPPPAPVPSPTLLFVVAGRGPGAPQVTNQVQSVLVAAGYPVVLEARAAHDGEVRLQVNATEKPSMVQVRVNGRVRRTYQVDATLVVQAQGAVIEQTSAQFETDGVAMPGDAGERLAGPLRSSPRMLAFAQQAAAARLASAQQAAAAREAVRRQKAEEAAQKDAAERAEWDGIVGECRAPKTLRSCDSLKAWVARMTPRRSGIDTTYEYQDKSELKRKDDAREILDAAAPVLKDIADAEQWARVDVARCTTAASDDACTPVLEYRQRFPTGKHIEEANAAAVEGLRKLETRAALERRRREAEERSAAQRQQQAGCKRACPGKCVAFTVDDKKAQCLAQCEQECN